MDGQAPGRRNRQFPPRRRSGRIGCVLRRRADRDNGVGTGNPDGIPCPETDRDPLQPAGVRERILLRSRSRRQRQCIGLPRLCRVQGGCRHVGLPDQAPIPALRQPDPGTAPGAGHAQLRGLRPERQAVHHADEHHGLRRRCRHLHLAGRCRDPLQCVLPGLRRNRVRELVLQGTAGSADSVLPHGDPVHALQGPG